MESQTSSENLSPLHPGSDVGVNGGGGPPDSSAARAVPRPYDLMVVEFWRDIGLGIAWTDGKTGEDAKRSTTSWNKQARAIVETGSAAAIFAHKIKSKNPIAVAHAVEDPNAREFVLIDCDGAEDVNAFNAFGAPATLTARSSTPDKIHLYYYAPGPYAKIHRIRFEGGGVACDKNGYLVSPPARHPSGAQYTWLDRSVPVAELPLDIYTAMVGAVKKQDAAAKKMLKGDDGAKITEGSRHTWMRAIVGALVRYAIPEEMALQVLLNFNATRCDPPKPEHLVEALVKDGYGRWTPADLDDIEAEIANYTATAPPAPVKPTRRPGLKDDDLAAHFVRVYGKSMRYFLETKSWIFFEGSRWHELGGSHMAKEACTRMLRSIYKDYAADIDRAHADPIDVAYAEAAEKFSHEKRIRPWRDAALDIAEPRLLVMADQLNRDPDILAVGNGVLDLKTFEIRPEGGPEDFVTVGSSINYVPEARSALWEDIFLPMAFPDADLRAYLARWGGLCLTGLTREEMMWVFWGRGRNGKGTFLGGIETMLGPELAIQINFATLATNKYTDGSAPSSDVARMRGKRLVIASEKNPERLLDEERIKRLTGGDPITARYLHENEMQFLPSHKLVLSVNDKPKISATDEAMRARVILVPFTSTFTRENGLLDTTLKERLHTEAEHLEGILAWAVRGLREYRAAGAIGTCQVIQDATAAYLTEMNPLTDFLALHFEVGDGLTATGDEVDKAYREYLYHADATRLSSSDFAQALRVLGFTRKRTEAGSVWTGLKSRGAVL